MNTISDLRKALGLSTTNQVRNRIEAIKDILSEYLRRGPNNQILITDDGVALLRRLQDLYDSGLTMTEASEILRSNADKKPLIGDVIPTGFVSNRMNHENNSALIAALKEEIAFLRERVAFLEEERRGKGDRTRPPAWWEGLREDL
ncbi:MAG: hypothetical protein U9N00_05275 [Candidatus Bipolaricaulota bacterium]|nr:hypothetical protein [Candidatus Bipolaricaulota bacterium]